MHQPSQQPRYQLFPSSSQEKLAITTALGRRTPELDQTPNAMAAKGNAVEGPSPTAGTGLKREPSLGRRRKPSVTDLGHMATVQEVAMDSRKLLGSLSKHLLLTNVSNYTREVSNTRALNQRSRRAELETERLWGVNVLWHRRSSGGRRAAPCLEDTAPAPQFCLTEL